MAKSNFRIKAYKHPRLKFVVRTKITGKWVRKFFETRGEAESFAAISEMELLNKGIEGVAFPSWLRVMAERENHRLQPFGKTISDAAEFYLKHLEATKRSVPVSVAMAELIENRNSSGASSRYCYDLGLRIGRFCKDFSGRTVAEIKTADVDAWLAKLGRAPVTRNTFRRDLNTLFSFALTRGYCVENPAARARKAKEVTGDIKILTVAQLQQLLAMATPETIPFWAIGAFGGLRRSEIERLDWTQIDFDSEIIEVKARQSKTAARRLVTMQPNLCAWLAPYRRAEGSVCPLNLRKLLDEDRDRAGLKSCWPQNGLRHSFGSYHLAYFKDAAGLALQMGNSPAVIFKHYRELVKPKNAAAYWGISPSDEAGGKILVFR